MQNLQKDADNSVCDVKLENVKVTYVPIYLNKWIMSFRNSYWRP